MKRRRSSASTLAGSRGDRSSSGSLAKLTAIRHPHRKKGDDII
jgi:hypothetical protein